MVKNCRNQLNRQKKFRSAAFDIPNVYHDRQVTTTSKSKKREAKKESKEKRESPRLNSWIHGSRAAGSVHVTKGRSPLNYDVISGPLVDHLQGCPGRIESIFLLIFCSVHVQPLQCLLILTHPQHVLGSSNMLG